MKSEKKNERSAYKRKRLLVNNKASWSQFETKIANNFYFDTQHTGGVNTTIPIFFSFSSVFQFKQNIYKNKLGIKVSFHIKNIEICFLNICYFDEPYMYM